MLGSNMQWTSILYPGEVALLLNHFMLQKPDTDDGLKHHEINHSTSLSIMDYCLHQLHCTPYLGIL